MVMRTCHGRGSSIRTADWLWATLVGRKEEGRSGRWRGGYELRIQGGRGAGNVVAKPIVVIVGETASGKSALALELAEKFNGEIIAADSRTIYKGMDIGTAKPSKKDQQGIKHHLLDIVTPDQPFTVADFKRLAREAIANIHF